MKEVRHDPRTKDTDAAYRTPAAAGAASPVASVSEQEVPSALRGCARTIAKALEGRLSDFATGQQG